MKARADAIDVLRCIAIVGMVFSGQIAWTQGLPMWMYHGQVPPPAFTFDPSVYGITWVDLVFPFFIFAMGAAIPLSLRRKFENGKPTLEIIWGLFKRGLLLVLFAIVLGNTGFWIMSGNFGPAWGSLAAITIWILLSAMFIRFPKSGREFNNTVNIAGGILLIGTLTLYHYVFGLPFSIGKNDAIIHVLATLAVTGGILWIVTRDDIKTRIFLTALAAAVKISMSVEGSWLAPGPGWESVAWLTRPTYLGYLCILLPGTIAGDMVWRWLKLSRPVEGKSAGSGRETCAAVLMAVTVVVTLWAMFTRNVGTGALWAIVSGAGIVALLKTKAPDDTWTLHYRLACIGVLLLVTGFVLEPFESGVRKDPSTLSYLFTTAGLSSYTLAALSVLLTRTNIRTGFLRGVGQNPMIAYTAGGYLVTPIFTLTGVSGLLGSLAATGPAGGLTRGVIVTLAAMTVTWAFSKKKYYWKI